MIGEWAQAEVMVESALVARASYVRALRPKLAAQVFERAPTRLAFVPAYLAVIVGATLAIAERWVPSFTFPVMALVIGASFAGLTFVAHELLHGGIIGGRRWQHVIGWIGFAPFVVSPVLWSAWHNRVHHARANGHDDPDAYPTLDSYWSRWSTRFSVDRFALGGGRWRGVLSIVLGFSVQSADQLFRARARGYLTPREHRRALAETALAVALWAVVAWLVGFVAFVFVFVVPLLVANACVMSFILTNHSLSPRVEIDDPLASGLSVTTPRLVEWLTLGFGFHVEHHLFPAMSTRHAPAVRAALRTHWPERYRSMSLARALRELHRTARVYKDAITLVDPRTGREHGTLWPARSADHEGLISRSRTA